jgi:ketopantoate reductase
MEEEVSIYRRLIKDLIQEYANYPPSVGDIQTEVVLDDSIGHYELLHSGWSGSQRIHGAVLHIDIRDGMVVIQHDETPDAVAEILVARGIPRDRIVLAFKAPEMRKYTGYAVA